MRTLLFLLTLQFLSAQPCLFKNIPSASLTPSPATRLNLVRQPDGSYTSFETANTAPYQLYSATPHFEKQLNTCLPSKTAATPLVAPANPAGSSSQPLQAVALLKSGNYLVVTINYAAVFDPQMNLLSISNVPVIGNMALADVNGDGNPDIVWTTNGRANSAGTLNIMLGNGGSSFQPAVLYSIPGPLVQVSSFAIGDLNGDKKPDIAIAITPSFSQTGSIITFLGNGDGTFQPGPSLALTGQPTSVALADLNGDGKLDLAASLGLFSSLNSSSVAVALGNGDGTFATPSYPLALGSSIAIGDMNADGIPDIVTMGTILFGDGKGSFPKRQDYIVQQLTTADPPAVILTDFDGDGRTDVVIAGGSPALITGVSSSTIQVLFGQPDGTFFAPTVSLAPRNDNTDLRTADFNNDGIPDIVSAGGSGVNILLGKGDGTFASSFIAGTAIGWYLATGDFDRDGNQDIVALLPYPKASLTFLAGKGDGTFRSPITISLSGSPAALVSGDFNGDGNLDLAILVSIENNGTSDEVKIYLGNGDGTFRPGASYPTGPVGNWMLAGDLNNDGKIDLIVTNVGAQSQTGNGNVSTFLGKGDGTFVQVSQLPLPVLNGEGYAGSMTLVDFNGDGKLDLAMITPAGFAILLGKGDGTLSAPSTTSLPSYALAAADVNDDGIPDLIAYAQVNNVTPRGLYYLLGNGDGSFQPQVALNVPAGQTLAVADFNRDGKPDLLTPFEGIGFASLMNIVPGPPPFKLLSSASFALGPVAPNSFVSAFGNSLSGSILVTDSTGASRSVAPLYSSPSQVNFVMPAATSLGVATVTIGSQTAQIQIVPLAPALFPAYYAIRIDAQGNQTTLPISAPIDLGSPTDKTFLVLFGTGFDHVDPITVNVTISGQTLAVPYIGPQGLPALDQVNVLLLHNLAGSGRVPVTLSTGGIAANPVQITIQ